MASTPNSHQPAWVQQIKQKYADGISHAFILHFNTADYAIPGVSVKSYLAQMFAKRQCVAFYNRSEGFTFPVESHREVFMQLAGLDQKTAAQDIGLAGLTGGPGPHRNDPKTCLMLITRVLRVQQETGRDPAAAIIIEYPEALFPEGSGTPDDRTILTMGTDWGSDPRIMSSGNTIVFLARNLEALSSDLRAASARYEAIEIPLPDHATRSSFIQWYLDGGQAVRLEAGLTVEVLANMTSALSLVGIEDIFLRAYREKVLTAEMVKTRKAEIISSEYTDVLEVMEPTRTFDDIGDLEYVKSFFRKNVITPIRCGNLGRVPMGVLMTGPAGTGKSVMAEAVAKESGLNCCVLNPAKLFNQYVGGTEQRVHRVFRAILSLAPAIVFVDEIDQSLSRGESGDSGVSNRFFKAMLEFMSDTHHRGRVVFLAATNRPDMMDAALRRPGRFDKKIPFLIPNANGRRSIFEVMIRRYFAETVSPTEVVIDQTENWTGAEIEAATVKALELVQDDNLDIYEALEAAVSRMIPSTADIEFMTQIAIRECNDLDLLPPEYRDRTMVQQAKAQPMADAFEDQAERRRRPRDF